MAVIVLNAGAMACEHYGQTQAWTDTLSGISYACTAVFIVEAIIKLVAMGRKYFNSRWNAFDFFCVATALAGPRRRRRKHHLGVARVSSGARLPPGPETERAAHAVQHAGNLAAGLGEHRRVAVPVVFRVRRAGHEPVRQGYVWRKLKRGRQTRARKRKRDLDAQAGVAFPGLADVAVSLVEKHLPDPADLAVLRAVSQRHARRGGRDRAED